MNSLFDILLKKPIPDDWLHGLLFASFSIHILFVLLTIGTAVLSVYYFIGANWGGKPDDLRIDRRILRTFMAHKSLAVVLGVAPLLLMQLVFTVPFFTAINLFAPFWICIVVFLIIAFVSFDILGHKIYIHPYVHIFSGIIALVFLLAVPAIFVSVLITQENPDKWITIISHDYRLSGPLATHWFFRYLHILGASIVFGSAFHYFFSARNDSENRSLLKWIVAGLLMQIILGLMLYSSLLERPDYIVNVSLFVGVSATSVLLWMFFNLPVGNMALNIKTTVPILMVILVSMLLTRQFIQYKKLLPFENHLDANAEAYQVKLQPYNHMALDKYESEINVVYDNGETIYLKSCAFCHGEKADDNGLEAKNFAIPPEDISAIRTTGPYLRSILVKGVQGSAMPYFGVFDRDKIDSLIDYLNKKYHVLGQAETVSVRIPYAALRQAKKIYNEACSKCHGMDGRGSVSSKEFKPRPPDLTVYALSPEKSFDVISKGYPGTAMPPFSDLPEYVRWGLVKITNDKRI